MVKDTIDILKKNRESVSEEELKTKYRTAYHNLLRKVSMETTAYCKKQILAGLKVSPDDSATIQKVQDIVTNAKPAIKDAVFVKMDFGLLEQISANLRSDVEKIIEGGK